MQATMPPALVRLVVLLLLLASAEIVVSQPDIKGESDRQVSSLFAYQTLQWMHVKSPCLL
jgi:hypothetical protein